MKKILGIGFILLLLASLVGGFFLYRNTVKPLTTSSLSFYVWPSDSFPSVLHRLDSMQLIQQPLVFNAIAKKMGLDRKVHTGHYLVDEGTNTLDLIRMLRGGLQTPVDIIINHVQRPPDVGRIVAEQLMLDSAAVMQALFDSTYIDSLGFTADNALTYVIPNTYEFYWNVSAEGFRERMLKEYYAFWTNRRLQEAKSAGLTPSEVIVLASIVQKEMQHKEEAKTIAGLYRNRLDKGMKLQADPTLLYILNDTTIRRVINIHKKIESPYNTYLYKGLPPGPLCLPSIHTIEAVLNPADHNYLYMCAKEDFSGYHRFAETHAQHAKNAQLYHDALNKRNIYR